MNKELAEKLKEMHGNAKPNESTDMIRLFGVLYADELEKFKVKDLDSIGKYATGKLNYGVEIRKGVKLAKYVQIRPEFKNKF